MNTAARESRLKSIDIWRGIAALAVVAMHMRHDAPGGFREHPFFVFWFLSEYGYLGVSLFVVISGFCIHRTSALSAARTGHQQLDWRGFWKRRFWRLYPTYVAAIVFTIAVTLLATGRFLAAEASFAWDLITHLLLFHNLTDEFNTGLGNGVFWSLGMEEQLYGLYYFLFLMFRRGRYRFALVAVALLTTAWKLAGPWMTNVTLDLGPFRLGSWYQWPFFYALHWTLGALAVDACLGNITLPRWCASLRLGSALLVAGMALNRIFFGLLAQGHVGGELIGSMGDGSTLAMTLESLGDLMIACSFFVLINWSLGLERAGRLPSFMVRIFAPVGRISYSLYLTHVPVLVALEAWLPQQPTPQGWIVRWAIYWPAVLLSASAFYYTVERRFLYTARLRPAPVPSDLLVDNERVIFPAMNSDREST